MTRLVDAQPTAYRFADLVLDTGRRLVTRGGQEIALGQLTYRLLLALLERAPNVVTHDELVASVWNGRATSPETVTQRVKLLRDALGDDPLEPRYVASARGHGYRLLAPVSFGAKHGRREPFAARPRSGPRLAVLPLANLSGDEELEYFAEGMTEALIASVATLPGLQVISRTSVMRFKRTELPLPEIARILDVDAIIEGSAQLSGARARITAQLIDVESDTHLWANTYDRELKDVLRVQSDIAQSIAGHISLSMPRQATGAQRQVDPDTYKDYLKGMFHLNKGSPEGIQRGLAHLHAAVERSPEDALAHAALAGGYALLWHGPAPPPNADVLSRAAALRAVELDPTLAEAHAALADIEYYLDSNWTAAEASFQRANELNPSLPMNHFHYSWMLCVLGRTEEAVREHKLAQELDPLTPLHTAGLGLLYVFIDRESLIEEAIAECDRGVELDPQFAIGHFFRGWVLSAGGRHEEAIAAHRRAHELLPPLKWALGMGYGLAGRSDEARAVLHEVLAEPRTPFNAYGLATLYTVLGEYDSAFEMMRFTPAHPWLSSFRVDPIVRPRLEHDPRFAEFLARFGLRL